MGHVYIERTPRTRTWRAVVEGIAAGADAAAVAQSVIVAAKKIILPFAKDQGVVEAVWRLIQLPLAARDEDFGAALRRLDVRVDDRPDLMELLAAVAEAIDRVVTPDRRTDLGEMAQMALIETLARRFGEDAATLLGDDPDDLCRAVAATATVAQFGRLAVAFFAAFVRKVLDFFVSKTLANHVGAQRRFTTLACQGAFTDALGVYAGEVAAGMEVYAGEWFSKHKFVSDGRISRAEAKGFLSHAADKLDWSLNRG